MTIKYDAREAEQVAVSPMEPRGYHLQISDFDEPVLLVPPIGRDCRYLMMQVYQSSIRYTITAAAAPSNPAADFGFRLIATDFNVLIAVWAGAQVRVIEEKPGAILEYQWLE